MRQSLLRALVLIGVGAVALLLTLPPAFAEKQGGAPAKAKEDMEFAGGVISVDAAAGTLMVKHVMNTTKVSRTFKVGEKTTLTGVDGKTITLADIKVSERVKVAFVEKDGTFTATSVTVLPAKKDKEKK